MLIVIIVVVALVLLFVFVGGPLLRGPGRDHGRQIDLQQMTDAEFKKPPDESALL
jgi:hypothetical protein